MIEHIHKLKDMRKQVRDELVHIPRWDYDQNTFRQVYWGMRLHSLGKKAKHKSSKEEVFVSAIGYIQKDNPNFCPRYNDKFFDKKNLCQAAKRNARILGCIRDSNE